MIVKSFASIGYFDKNIITLIKFTYEKIKNNYKSKLKMSSFI